MTQPYNDIPCKTIEQKLEIAIEALEWIENHNFACDPDVNGERCSCNKCFAKRVLQDISPTEQHQFHDPHHDEGCIKCGGMPGEPCEPPEPFVSAHPHSI